jgi:hypothetical protein
MLLCLRLGLLFPDSEDSLWRPLHGPNDDWSLPVCDFSSVDEDMTLE